MRKTMRTFGWTLMGVILALVGTDAGRAQIGLDAGQILSQARQAIGGDAKINEIKNLSLTGRVRQADNPGEAKNLKMHIFVSEPGMMAEGSLPGDGKHHRIIIRKKIEGDALPEKIEAEGGQEVRKRIMVIADDKGVEGGPHRAMIPGFFHYEMGLFLKAPFGGEFTYVGDSEDGRADVLEVKSKFGSEGRVLIDKASRLPVGFKFRGPQHNVIFVRRTAPEGEGNVDIIKERRAHFDMPAPKEADIEFRFSDHRLVDGVMLPHQITKSVNGKITEEWEIDKYELNPEISFDKMPKID
jgi:hypothetical protein